MTIELARMLAPFGVIIMTLAGLILYTHQQGVSTAELSARDLDERTNRQLAGPRVVGSLAVVLLIASKWTHQYPLMTWGAMPLILFSLVWHTLLMIRIRQNQQRREKYRKKKRKR